MYTKTDKQAKSQENAKLEHLYGAAMDHYLQGRSKLIDDMSLVSIISLCLMSYHG